MLAKLLPESINIVINIESIPKKLLFIASSNLPQNLIDKQNYASILDKIAFFDVNASILTIRR